MYQLFVNAPTMKPGGSRSFKVLTNIKFEKVWPYLTKKIVKKECGNGVAK